MTQSLAPFQLLHRSSMKCPCRSRCATQKTKETEKAVTERWEQVSLIHQQATTNWESLIGKILKIFHKQRLAGLHLSHMKNYAWMTKSMNPKKTGPKQK